MLDKISSGLKKHAPVIHRALKRGMERSRFPVPKMVMGRPVWTQARLVRETIWGSQVLHWIVDGIRPGDVFFDVGAHHGWMSLVASRRTGRTGRVVAFEPSPPSVELLRYHKRVNRLSQMEIVPKAVSREDGTRPFFLVGDGNAVMNSLVEIEEAANSPRGTSAMEVETVCLDSFSRQTGLVPRMIKIDTEGAELMVCEGAGELLARRHPALIIATHPTWLPEGRKIEDLFEMLKGLGYRMAGSDVLKYNGADFGDYLFVA